LLLVVQLLLLLLLIQLLMLVLQFVLLLPLLRLPLLLLPFHSHLGTPSPSSSVNLPTALNGNAAAAVISLLRRNASRFARDQSAGSGNAVWFSGCI
jgi:hypothetical protein